MAGINKAIIVGRLGRDPEIRYTQDGKAVASFSVATSEEWTDKLSGEKKERTEWHRIVAFGRLGELCGEYLTKGRQVYIEGRLQTRSWDKDGVTRYTTEIQAAEVQFLGGKDDGGQRSPGARSGNESTARPDRRYSEPGERDTGPIPGGPDPGDGSDDDIPF